MIPGDAPASEPSGSQTTDPRVGAPESGGRAARPAAVSAGPGADDPVAEGAPWWGLLALGAALAAGLAGVPQGAMAIVLAALYLAATAWHPALGLVGLVLMTVGFLGEHKTPYFLLLHGAAAALVGSGLVHQQLGWQRLGRGLGGPRARGAALALVLAAALAIPLDLRAFIEHVWLGRSLDWARMLTEGINDLSPFKYVERILVLALGAGLFLIATRAAMARALAATFPALSVIVGVVAGFGLLRFFGLVRTTGQYLGLSFWTWQHPDLRLTGVAWNPDHLAQFLVLTLPLVLTVAWTARPAGLQAVAGVSALLGVGALACTFQRAAYLALAVALGSLVGLRACLVGVGRRQLAGWVAAAVALVLVLDAAVLGGRVASRFWIFAYDPNRLWLWGTALRMAADNPLLGVGAGRYASFFEAYAGPGAREALGPFWGTAHSTGLHVLAEQGMLGLATLVVLFGGAWVRGLGGARRLSGDDQSAAVALLAALAGWAAYGVVQYVFRVDALLFLAAIFAGALVGLAPPTAVRSRVPPIRWLPPGRWALALAGGLLLGLAGLRVEAALRRPVPPGYEAGFHRWERQADNSAARWTRRRAALALAVRGPILVLRLRAPLPGVEARPQVVRVWVDGKPPQLLRLTDGGWHWLIAPVSTPVGGATLVELEAAYTVVPSRLRPLRDDRELGVMLGEVGFRTVVPLGDRRRGTMP